MDVDSEIAPLMEKMNAELVKIKTQLVPRLDALDEDSVVTSYSPEEQARLYISAAFTLAFSLYSLDKLHNKQNHAHKLASSANTTANSGGGVVDAQLVLKMERITDYIKKLREITTLDRARRDGEKTERGASAVTDEATTTTTTTTSTAKTLEVSQHQRDMAEATPGKKRGRGVTGGMTSPSRGAAQSESKKAKTESGGATGIVEEKQEEEEEGEDLGDAEMFSTVSRVPGEVGNAVGRLLKQVISHRQNK